jgi:DNA mismatch endonuclease (patch repair protein)
VLDGDSQSRQSRRDPLARLTANAKLATASTRFSMADRLSRERRSWNMSRIRGRDTAPERHVRSILHRMGCRFRLHVTRLPGRPDVVLPRYRSVVVVHGCFWHRHADCKHAYTPKSNIEFWAKKFNENVDRDRRTTAALKKLGWRVIIVWECELGTPARLRSRLIRLLSGSAGRHTRA